MVERDLSYYTFRCANEIGMMLYYKKDVQIIMQYVEDIIRINNLYEVEKNIWDMVYKTIKITNEYTISNVKDIFRDNRLLSDEEIDELNNENIVDKLDDTLSYYKRLYERKSLLDRLELATECLDSGRDIDTNEIINVIEKFNNYSNEISNTIESLQEKYDDKRDNTKISTTIDRIDKIGAEYTKGTVNTVFAYTGCYKTMYCTNVAYKAISNNLNVCYISLEVPEENMYYNFLSRYSNESTFEKVIQHVDLKRRNLEKSDKEYVFKKVLPEFKEKLSKHLIILDECNSDVDNYLDFTIMLKRVDDEFINRTNKGIDLVIVDHINLLKFNQSNNMNDYSRVNHWMSFFRKNSINFVGRKKQVCFLIAAQSSRSGYDRARNNGGEYTLDGIAEGNEIERASTTVISIYSDATLKQENTALMQLLKGRDCEQMYEPISVKVNAKSYLIEDEGEELQSDNENFEYGEDLEEDYDY